VTIGIIDGKMISAGAKIGGASDRPVIEADGSRTNEGAATTWEDENLGNAILGQGAAASASTTSATWTAADP